MSIVSTNINYSYEILKQNLKDLKSKYNFLKIDSIGKSILDKDIYVIKLGKGPKKVLYTAAFHANEWITSVIMMKFIEDYCNSYVLDSDLFNFKTKEIFENVSIYIVPMVNPDGVNLVTNSIDKFSYGYMHAKKIASKYPKILFPSGWKANINGVDLNLQFPAEFQKAKKIKYSLGFTSPSPRDFVGFGPLSEPESFSLFNFTTLYNFDLVLAYHSQGKEIYSNFQNYNTPNSIDFAKKLSDVSGYSIAEVPYNSSFAGFKDWFIQEYNKLGFTIEVGIGENPLPIEQFDEIYNDNLGILVLSAIL